MPVWTKEQSEAINKENTNIIVSAGAGSGKTAVLSERVIRKLKNNINVDELLIMTFTKAAASEMKERIRKKIKKDESLLEQLKLIDSAYITTFDSYALSVVKKYHYLLNISNNIGIVDNTIITLKKEELINEIFEDLYREEDENFISLISDFCIKDDGEIKKQILLINNKLDMLPNKEKYLEEYIEKFYDKNKIQKDIEDYLILINRHIMELEELSIELSNYVSSDYMQKLELVLLPIFNSKTYEEIKENLNNKLPRLEAGSSEEAKTAKDNLAKKIKFLSHLCRYETFGSLEEDYYKTKKYLNAICNILLIFNEKLSNYKYENDIYEFNDIAKLSIKLVRDFSSVREQIKSQFKEIMIDEYQDTSDLQEEFVSYIANNNVYMVGDIKQSIYRFRNANPYIFKTKYDNYSKNIDGYKIDLNKNFRSRLEVLENINLIFRLIMDDNIGGANYIKEHQMNYGNKAYIEEGKTEQNNDLELLKYNYDKDNNYTKDEIECFIIANDIIEKVKNKYLVFDKDEKILRPITYSDFAILLDRTSKFDLFKKIFEYLQVPLNVLKDEKLNNSQDMYVLNNLINLIVKIKKREYDKEFKYSYISVARSFLFNMKDDEIFNIFANNSFYTTELFVLSHSLIEDIDILNINSFVEKVLFKFDFYEKLILIGDVENSIIKIDNILNMANNLTNLGYTVYDFASYLSKIIKENYQMTYTVNNDYGDAVKIMTIHKSKGLEYHICYFANLYNKFNISDLNEKFIYDNKYGIIAPFIDDGIETTFYKELVKDNYIKEEISEKIRLFYVALTRAKEKIIMVLPSCDNSYITNKLVIPDDVRNTYCSFLDIINSIDFKLNSYTRNINLEKIKITKDYNSIRINNYQDKIKANDTMINVSEIKMSDARKESKIYSKKTNDIFSIEDKKNIELGLKFHKYLENYDFNNPKEIEDKFINSKIVNFLNQELLSNISSAKIFHEYEFIYEENNIENHGIIDLMLEYENYIDIIDYKLKKVADDNYLKQLNGYKKFIEKKTNKEVNTYLYSIIDDEVKKI